jgi:hypothetical protein
MLWAGEIKGGADPAACEKTGRPKPALSFIATIIVERVAREARQWIDQGKLTSVYNLTKIAENPGARQAFLEDMTAFLGCE